MSIICTFNGIDGGQKTPLTDNEALIDSVAVDVHEVTIVSVRSEMRVSYVKVSQ